MTLRIEDFATFFQEVYGYPPFPWQMRLLQSVAENGVWPRVLGLPTGAGKTAAIDIAVFHLALEAGRGRHRRAPVRIAFIVDRRLVVDDAYERARRLETHLSSPELHGVTAQVAASLKTLSDDGLPLIARRMRGGVPREDDWARTPAQPTVLCSTVDQVGSRLLFRGYGVSDSMKPVHAGLLGSDCLILLDEAHLAEPFRQTLEWIEIYRGEKWREVVAVAPWGAALLTATPGDAHQDFALEEADRANPVLKKRLEAKKPASLRLEKSVQRDAGDRKESDDSASRADVMVRELRTALEHFAKTSSGGSAPAIGIVMNRVNRAREVFQLVRMNLLAEIERGDIDPPILMIGAARPLDRDDLAELLNPIRTGAGGVQRKLAKPLIIVATQCIEAGVDIDLDVLITELAPLDSLRQRFGRLNRAGRGIAPYASIIAMKNDISSRSVDRVYATSLKAAWEKLDEAAEQQGDDRVVEFGINGFEVVMDPAAISPRDNAPVLLPAHVDLLTQTSPIPATDPEVGLYLHGPVRQPDSVTLLWRADIDPNAHREQADLRRILTLVPPRSAEAIQLPVWKVREWLRSGDASRDDLADVSTVPPDDDRFRRPGERPAMAFRWSGDDEQSGWIDPDEIRPGDTIVVPARYGRLDEFGWNPAYSGTVTDRGEDASEPFAARRYAVRVAPGLLVESVTESGLAEAIAANIVSGWKTLRDALLNLELSEEQRNALLRLDDARRGRVIAYADLYGRDGQGRPRGVIFAAPLGLKTDLGDGESNLSTTEDDVSGSLSGFSLSLSQHSEDVEAMAFRLGRGAGLDEDRLVDVTLAAYLHDAGKADPRFQAWLYCGDPLGADPERLLAKSGRRLPTGSRDEAGLPAYWRHEALSVRFAIRSTRFEEARDPDLVLWLVGTHHGKGRTLFPHQDPTETLPDVGPQSLAFDWCGMDWPTLFATLKQRYGAWELARLEAIVRLSDHRASEMRAREARSS